MAEKPSEQQTRTPATTGGQNPMMELRRQMDRLFDDFTSGFNMPTFSGWGRAGSIPDVFGGGMDQIDVRFDVSESDKQIEVTAEVPGMKEQDIDVEVSGDVLTIKGEKKHEEEKKEKNYYLSERRYGSFQRSFQLPDTVDQEGIEAQFDKGVLKVTLPKKPESRRQAKKISVKGG